MNAILDIIDFIGTAGQGIGALISIGLIFTGRLTIRNFLESSW
jgi:hypothetical protein